MNRGTLDVEIDRERDPGYGVRQTEGPWMWRQTDRQTDRRTEGPWM